MTEDEYILEIDERWPKEEEVDSSLVALVSQGAREHPGSRRLAVMLGDLLQLRAAMARSFEEIPVAKASYLAALEIDPEFGEAWESLAEYVEIREDDLEEAAALYQRAVDHGGSSFSYIGRSRCLSELGRCEEALWLISRDECRHFDQPNIIALRQQIETEAELRKGGFLD